MVCWQVSLLHCFSFLTSIFSMQIKCKYVLQQTAPQRLNIKTMNFKFRVLNVAIIYIVFIFGSLNFIFNHYRFVKFVSYNFCGNVFIVASVIKCS